MSTHSCENCRWHAYAQRKPDSWLAKLWRWHTRWCPGWSAYQRELANRQSSQPDDPPGLSTDPEQP